MRRDVVLVDRDVLREGPDPQVAGAGVDLVAYLEVAYGRADPGHHAGDVVAEHERGPVLQEPLELAVADHLVQRVDAGGAHLDQHVTVAELGLGYVGGAESVLAVVLDDERLHDRSPRGELASRSRVVEGRQRVGRGADAMRRPSMSSEGVRRRGSSHRNSSARLTKSSWNWNTPPCPASG